MLSPLPLIKHLQITKEFIVGRVTGRVLEPEKLFAANSIGREAESEALCQYDE
jgi:hypothetical protein